MHNAFFTNLSSLKYKCSTFRNNPSTLLETISTSEIEVMLTILETERRPNIRKFFIALLKDFFNSGRSKHHLYSEGVIEALLSGEILYLVVLQDL